MTASSEAEVSTDSMRMKILLARELQDGDRVHIGANQEIVLDAVVLAQETRGINVRLTAVGGNWLEKPSRAMGLMTYNRDAVNSFDAPLDQERAFDNLNRPPIVFAGGLQIDQSGNVNLIGLGRDGSQWKVRGPGSAGLPSLTGLSSTFYAYTMKHDSRGMVPNVEHISAVGSPRLRAELGLPTITRGAVFTPLGRFSWHGDLLQLMETAPGITVEEVIERTSFWPDIGTDAAIGAPASEAELNWLDKNSSKG